MPWDLDNSKFRKLGLGCHGRIYSRKHQGLSRALAATMDGVTFDPSV